MSADLKLTLDPAHMVVHVEALTDAGTEFVDAYASSELVVVDSGWIILSQPAATLLLGEAHDRGLTSSVIV